MEHPSGAANDAHQLRGMKKHPDREQTATSPDAH